MKQRIFGRARSGKSNYVPELGTRGQHDVVLIATGTADDEGMPARTPRHWAPRPAHRSILGALLRERTLQRTYGM
jgi:adenosyl cobinamide kinase/adenosyl cobinamide phosphate guanylyltransferase